MPGSRGPAVGLRPAGKRRFPASQEVLTAALPRFQPARPPAAPPRFPPARPPAPRLVCGPGTTHKLKGIQDNSLDLSILKQLKIIQIKKKKNYDSK